MCGPMLISDRAAARHERGFESPNATLASASCAPFRIIAAALTSFNHDTGRSSGLTDWCAGSDATYSRIRLACRLATSRSSRSPSPSPDPYASSFRPPFIPSPLLPLPAALLLVLIRIVRANTEFPPLLFPLNPSLGTRSLNRSRSSRR
ncbi:hypothetical protein L1887_51520 [Cichorium endivia]|nr:hypothetical protein L1887_51520 [Cichorium endivia]